MRPSHPTWAQLSGGGARHAVDSNWVPAWLRPTGPENRLPVAASIVVAIALQIWLSGRYGLHPRWLLPLLEIALLVVLTAINPVRLSRQTRIGRYLSMALAGLITLDNVASAPRPGLRHPEWQDEQRCDRSAQHRRRDLSDEHHRLRHLVLGTGPWWPVQPGGWNGPAPGLPLPPDGLAGDGSGALGATLSRLPLHELHQRHGVLADRHDAAVAVGEVIDGPAKRHCPIDHGTCPRARRKHPEMT